MIGFYVSNHVRNDIFNVIAVFTLVPRSYDQANHIMDIPIPARPVFVLIQYA